MQRAIADFRNRLIATCGFAVMLFLAHAPAAAQSSAWTLTTADFNTRQVNLVAIDDAGAKVTSAAAGGSPTVVPWQQVLQLQRAGDPPKPDPATAKFTLYLAGGDRVAGEPLALKGETLGWNSPAAGRVDVKLKQVLAIARGAEQPPRRNGEQQRTEDVVALTNGDTARGLITAIDKSAVTVSVEGNNVAVPWETVRSVTLATVAGDGGAAAAKRQQGERGVRVTLADGSVLSGATIQMSGDKAMLGAVGGDPKRELAASAVIAIEQVNGPVAWLSSLPPAESVQTPFFETAFPARMDRTVRGEPIRFGDRTYPRGIGVHAYSRLTWQLVEGNRYKTFRTQYAIDGDKPYANVTVRVKLDERVVHEAQDFVAGKLADVVQLPLGGAKTLTLEVDYGKTYDVQDRFNWIEPALLTSE